MNWLAWQQWQPYLIVILSQTGRCRPHSQKARQKPLGAWWGQGSLVLLSLPLFIYHCGLSANFFFFFKCNTSLHQYSWCHITYLHFWWFFLFVCFFFETILRQSFLVLSFSLMSLAKHRASYYCSHCVHKADTLVPHVQFSAQPTGDQEQSATDKSSMPAIPIIPSHYFVPHLRDTHKCTCNYGNSEKFPLCRLSRSENKVFKPAIPFSLVQTFSTVIQCQCIFLPCS